MNSIFWIRPSVLDILILFRCQGFCGQASRMCITGNTWLLFTVRSLRLAMNTWHTNQETNSLQGEGRDPNPKGKCANLILNISIVFFILGFYIFTEHFSILTHFSFIFSPMTRKSIGTVWWPYWNSRGIIMMLFLLFYSQIIVFKSSKAHDLFHIHEHWHISRVLSLGGSKRLISTP